MDTTVTDYRCGEYTICNRQRRILRHDRAITLEAKVFDLIALLIEHREQALGKQQIVTALWGQRPVTDAALSQLVYKARRVFDDDGEHQRVIRTVYGRGLQWVAAVEPIAEPAPTPAPAPPMPSSVAPGVRARRRWLPWTITVVVIVAGLLVWQAVPRSDAVPPVPTPRLAMLPIDNTTGENALQWTSHGLPGLMASLMDTTPAISVVDPLQVAKVWGFTVPAGTSHLQHVRKATGAAILVSGRLRKLAGIYELSLSIHRRGHSDRTLTLTGSQPGQLAVAAVPRIRRILGLAPATEAPLRNKPHDAYLAQTFARGMDASTRGRWSDARPFFALCASRLPDFLPCRLRLGQAQAHTDQLAPARATLKALLKDAHQHPENATAARAMIALAEVDLEQNRASDALTRLVAAAPLAMQQGDTALRVEVALTSAKAAAVLKHNHSAQRFLQRARTWIAQAHLEDAKSGLYNAASFVASARGDYAAAAKADRAALDASVALGNERGALADTYNLGLARMQHGDAMQALPLLVDAYHRSVGLHDVEARFSAGNDLATILLQWGLNKRARQVIEQVLKIARDQDSPSWQAYAMSLRSDWHAALGQSADALADARAAVALQDADQDPATWVQLQYKAALLALPKHGTALAASSRRLDALVGKQPRPRDYAYWQHLTHALAFAAVNQEAAVHGALKKAHRARTQATARDDLRRTGLVIALANHDAGAARIALEDFDVSRCHAADVLQLARQWARQQGHVQAENAAGKRLAWLRKTARKAFDQASAATSPAP